MYMENNIIVCKFGGTSVRNEGQRQLIKEIVESDSKRRIIVVSAPGKCGFGGEKVTDLLILAYYQKEKFDFYLDMVENIFESLIRGLQIEFDLKSEIRKIKLHFKLFRTRSYLLSRGEYLTAKIFARYLDATFVDSAKIIKFDSHGKVKKTTSKKVQKMVKDHGKIILPGFYGSNFFGKIKVMSRGGSDITGAICAGAIRGSVYENWTDVDGVYDDMTSKNVIKSMSYDEVSFLSFFGASVLHFKSANFCKNAKTIVKNTFSSEKSGTEISNSSSLCKFAHTQKYGTEYILKDNAKIKKFLKKVKCEVLYKYILRGELHFCANFVDGYFKKCQKARLENFIISKRKMKIDAYIVRDEIEAEKIKNKHKNANFVLADCQKLIFSEFIG